MFFAVNVSGELQMVVGSSWYECLFCESVELWNVVAEYVKQQFNNAHPICINNTCNSKLAYCQASNIATLLQLNNQQQ